MKESVWGGGHAPLPELFFAFAKTIPCLCGEGRSLVHPTSIAWSTWRIVKTVTLINIGGMIYTAGADNYGRVD